MVIFRLIEQIKPIARDQVNILIMLYFVSIEKDEFNDFAEKLSKNIKLNDCYTLAWKIGVMEGNFKNEEIQQLVDFIRNHCKRNSLPLIEWLKVQSRV